MLEHIRADCLWGIGTNLIEGMPKGGGVRFFDVGQNPDSKFSHVKQISLTDKEYEVDSIRAVQG